MNVIVHPVCAFPFTAYAAAPKSPTEDGQREQEQHIMEKRVAMFVMSIGLLNNPYFLLEL